MPDATGSSPLARGLLVVVSGRVFSCGIIPARAGFTDTLSCHNRLVGDHPRSRGVYLASAGRKIIDGGSSPLARGLLQVQAQAHPQARIIPARAGFTVAPVVPYFRQWDHPRSRGVYGSTAGRGRKGRGSSPLARGLHRQGRPGQERQGIIPARAGFTLGDPWNPNDA